jgi:hypothetical protein
VEQPCSCVGGINSSILLTRSAASPLVAMDHFVERVRGDGVVEVPFFLFGRLSGGPLVGLRSIAIET